MFNNGEGRGSVASLLDQIQAIARWLHATPAGTPKQLQYLYTNLLNYSTLGGEFTKHGIATHTHTHKIKN